MDGQRRFAVIGTDARLAAAGRALARAGFAVGGPEQTALADYILLPLPLDESRTPLAELLRAAKPGALALGGKLSAQARQIAAEAGVELVDYFARKELILCNAIPTAEGCFMPIVLCNILAAKVPLFRRNPKTGEEEKAFAAVTMAVQALLIAAVLVLMGKPDGDVLKAVIK